MKIHIPFKTIFFFIAIAIAIGLSFFPIAHLPVTFSYSAAVVLITLVGWSTGVMPPFMVALLFFALTMIFDLTEPAVLFSGFGSTAVWLVISGFVIGSAISASGLASKFATSMSPYLVHSYPRLIIGLIFSSALLGFIMPSSVGRAVVMLPIGMALADHLGFSKGSNGRLGIATALAISCNMPSFAILPSNIPNMILAGASENLFGLHFSYTEYLYLHYPVLGIIKSFVLAWLVLRLFPAEINNVSSFQTLDNNHTTNKSTQFKVGLLLGATLLLWITDSLHGISPAWIGLAAAILLLLPKWGVLEAKSFNTSIDFGTVVFIAAALGLGALVNTTGIGTSVGSVFANLLPQNADQPFLSFISLSLMATFTSLVTTILGVPTVLTPMAADFAQATGFSISTVLMTQVVGFATILFPYQAPPLIIAMQLSKEPISHLLKVLLPLAAISILLLMPLEYLWWELLGKL